MRSNERTLIAALGFADTDKKNPNHDYITLKLASNPWSTKICQSLCMMSRVSVANVRAATEVAIAKGQGQYKSIVGFVDVVLDFRITGVAGRTTTSRIAIEVKATWPGHGEILRQINFYREFYDTDWWLVATPDKVADAEWNLLLDNKVLLLELWRAPDEAFACVSAVALDAVRSEARWKLFQPDQ